MSARVDRTAALDDVKTAGMILFRPVYFVGGHDDKADNFDMFLPRGESVDRSKYAKPTERIKVIEQASLRNDRQFVFNSL